MSVKRSTIGIAMVQFIREKPPRPPLLNPPSRVNYTLDIVNKLLGGRHVVFPLDFYRIYVAQQTKENETVTSYVVNNE